MTASKRLPPYRASLAGTLLAAREAVMAPIRPFLRAAGVTEQQWRVLRVLADAGPLDPSGLAAAALLHPPSVTRILKELAERQLVVREADPADGRRSVIRLSAAGQALVERTADHMLALLELYAAGFGRDRLATLQRELAALAAAIPRAVGERPDLNPPVEGETAWPTPPPA